jgi:hypothetical protein
LHPVFFPAQRRLGHRPIHRLPLPFQTHQVIVFQQGHGPEVGKTATLDQRLKVAVQRAPRTERLRNGLPLATGPQHIENAVDHPPPRQRRPPAHLPLMPFRQQRFDAFPHLVGHAKTSIDNFFLLHP